MSAMRENPMMDGMGETYIRALGANVMATPISSVRFWIITMMLVVFGLSTLKLR